MSMNTIDSPLIVELPRGPSIAGTRITVYSVMDYIKANRSKEYILEMMPAITETQLDAVYEYIEQHKEEVERDYAEILRRTEELRERYDKIFWERTGFPTDLPLEERKALLKQRREAKRQELIALNGNHGTPR
ncbi:MAG: DUF433 domain-containing protein [Blastocatellia bacterium]